MALEDTLTEHDELLDGDPEQFFTDEERLAKKQRGKSARYILLFFLGMFAILKATSLAVLWHTPVPYVLMIFGFLIGLGFGWNRDG